MLNRFKTHLVPVCMAVLLIACSESESPEETAVQLPEETLSTMAIETPVAESVTSIEEVADATIAVVEEEVIGEAPVDAEEIVSEVIEEAKVELASETTEVVAEAEMITEEIVADVTDKPYQVVDGKISENAMNGWRTYNGGGCGTCHGKGGIGAVGPNLANSVNQVLSKEQFMDVVTNGRSGTMMRPHKTNKRVMDNIEDLYVYLLARGDDVLGPGNLIKQPLGK